MSVIIIPTNRCNLRCKHCMRSKYGGEDLNLDILAKFLRGIRGYRFGRLLSLTGGEPTLYENMDGMMRMFRKFNFRVEIITNGQDEKRVLKIINYPDVVTNISISIDGPNSKVNDKIRGDGSFNNIIKAIKLYQTHGIEVRTRTVLHNNNKDCIEDMFILAVNNSIERIWFSTIHPNIKTEKHNLKVSQHALYRAYMKFKMLKNLFPNIRAGFNTRHMIGSNIPEWSENLCKPIRCGESIVLLPDGKVSFCCDLHDLHFNQKRYGKKNEKRLNHILGDYKNEPLDIILNRKKNLIEELRKRREKDANSGLLAGPRQFICENCKYYFYKN